MPFDIEIDEFHDENSETEHLAFHRENFVSCSNISIWKILREYLCWVLAGKPKYLEWRNNEGRNTKNT